MVTGRLCFMLQSKATTWKMWLLLTSQSRGSVVHSVPSESMEKGTWASRMSYLQISLFLGVQSASSALTRSTRSCGGRPSSTLP
uniref:Putative secreted protein n=1 Tax=Ixodes ricinus TaxID=34613 RepID=A0A6B0U7N5_IXORI